MANMDPLEKSKYFKKIGRKGGLKSKAAGTDYSKLVKIRYNKK